MKIYVFFLTFLFFNLLNSYNSDAYKSFTEYLESYLYPFEEHFLETRDSYILKIFRIQTKNQPKIKAKTEGKVILMVHGLADSSDTYIINKEEWAPALFFANKGHDVWLANLRGNKHSRNHTYLNPDKDKEFWDFSMDELISIDLPDIFKFIHDQTQQKINYIGHSQGSSILFAALSIGNEIIVNTLDKVFSFGPVIFLQDAKKHKPLKSFLQNPIVDMLVNYLRDFGEKSLFQILLKIL